MNRLTFKIELDLKRSVGGVDIILFVFDGKNLLYGADITNDSRLISTHPYESYFAKNNLFHLLAKKILKRLDRI